MSPRPAQWVRSLIKRRACAACRARPKRRGGRDASVFGLAEISRHTAPLLLAHARPTPGKDVEATRAASHSSRHGIVENTCFDSRTTKHRHTHDTSTAEGAGTT